ncbi:hypothetical protein MPDQ_003267 [Monascus purpureus]|uniref:Protein BIG1 n=1 Tax=Monascus purpureus TaxID=5098 RepID=A0A507QZ50_MONPU|nr:hypothetical protein MPDQ_003267 [Monascus purpureus]BDD55888.1 hypothetical protein MAP00_001371 [Monascus purpureus]
MYLSIFWLLAFGAAVGAFRDTSPFFLASTSEILASSAEIKTASSIFRDVSSELSACPSDYFVVAFQPGVHKSDYATRRSAPRLGAKVTGQDETIRSSMSVSEVAGVLDAAQIQAMIEKECKTRTTVIDTSSGSYPSSFDKEARIITVKFPMLSLGSDRAQQLSDNDGLLADIIDRIPSPSYTLLYVTSPKEFDDSGSGFAGYDFENNGIYQEPLHMQLKRDYSAHVSGKESASNSSVFAKYQFFTPGIFMGLMASFLFVSILYVGFSALSSLEVPYAAFEKDISAGAQKKQQ